MARSKNFRRSILIFTCALGCLQQTELLAHFLFIRIGEHAEAGRAAELFFSEKAEAGDPRFIEKIAATQLWMQHDKGTFVPLQNHRQADRLRALLPESGAVSVTGSCEYGVVVRDIPFLLRYYPKAISGPPAELNQLSANSKLPLEVMATVSAEKITLVLLDGGKPVPNAVFTTVDDDLTNEEIKADSEGRAEWKPRVAGHYCVYAKVVRNQSGERGEKKYTEIREFATLAFRWPLERTDGDAEAISLFEKAISARAHWSDFPGFTAKIEGDFDGRKFAGTVRVEKDGGVKLNIDQEVAVEWVDDQLRSIVLHRIDSPRRAEPVLRFADQDLHNPLGRLLTFVGGRFASSYRVKEDQLMVVNRNLGQENMTITILENEKTPEGKFLPHLYLVQYWNAANGSLLRTEAFENRWQRVRQLDLPAMNSVITSSSAGLTVRSFRLSSHELLSPN